MALNGQDRQQSLRLISHVIRIGGETLVTLDTRGVCHLSAGELAEAKADFQSALALYPHPVVHFHLAQLALLSGDSAEAERRFATARRAGLTRSDVHPLEFSAYDKLLRALKSFQIAVFANESLNLQARTRCRLLGGLARSLA